MKRIVVLLIAALAAVAAEDTWVRVKELKSGVELRIYQVNTKEPVSAKLDRASEESVIVITKSGQLSIPKEEIERLDCRREPPVRPVTRAGRKVAAKGAEATGNTIPGATTTVKTGLEFPSKSGFQTIYERKSADK